MKFRNLFLLFMLLITVLSGCQDKINDTNEKVNLSKHPNVIIILTSDQGYGDLACHGNPWLLTPSIDSLYSNSVRFTNFHTAGLPAPTRAGLFTGKEPISLGVYDSHSGSAYLSSEILSLPKLFKINNYKTALYGKWGLGNNSPSTPDEHGFEEVLIHKGSTLGSTADYWNNDAFDDIYFHNGYPKQYYGYTTDVWFTEAMKFILKNKDYPFFLFISTHTAQRPLHIAQQYIDLYDDNPRIPDPRFYGMITNLDENIGKLRQYLDSLHIADNTLLIFMSDNGTLAGAKTNQREFVDEGYNAGLRGIKGSPYDGGHRVPFFMYWKDGNLYGGKDITELTHYLDVMPTLLDICHLDVENDIQFDGLSLNPVLLGDTTWPADRMLFLNTQPENPEDIFAGSVVITSEWRMVNGREVYNMKRDSMERWNLSQYYYRMINEYRDTFENWWNSIQTTDTLHISLGSNEFPVALTASDWYPENDSLPYLQEHVRRGMISNGYWMTNIEKKGLYTFEMRRWPNEISKAFGDELPPPVRVPGSEPGQPGQGLIPVWTKLQVGNYVDSVRINPSDRYARFKIDLTEGEVRVKSWIRDTTGIERGAYYMYVYPPND